MNETTANKRTVSTELPVVNEELKNGWVKEKIVASAKRLQKAQQKEEEWMRQSLNG